MELDVVGSSYPQTATVPTRAETIEELCQYTGGVGSGAAERRAGASYDSAVRAYNSVLWKFNRKVNDITLTSGHTFDLTTDFAAPMRACMVDSGDVEVTPVRWMDWGVFQEWVKPRSGTGTMPDIYSCRNVHETGQVTVYPTLGSSLTYPTFRIHYFRRIVKASGDSRLNVPEEVYQGIFQLALAINTHKTDNNASKASTEYAIAASLRMAVEQRWRDWEDWT